MEHAAGVFWLGQRLGASEAIGIGLVVLASSGVMVTRRPGSARPGQ
jgi:threonine/homoserine efflux transporter RhtA